MCFCVPHSGPFQVHLRKMYKLFPRVVIPMRREKSAFGMEFVPFVFVVEIYGLVVKIKEILADYLVAELPRYKYKS